MVGRVYANGARDCGRGRGRVTAAVGVAGIPALELGADAAGGLGRGNGGEACRRVPPAGVAAWAGAAAAAVASSPPPAVATAMAAAASALLKRDIDCLLFWEISLRSPDRGYRHGRRAH